MYKPRTYRRWVKTAGLVSFEVIEKETDLFISASTLRHSSGSIPSKVEVSIDLDGPAIKVVKALREDIEDYAAKYPAFRTSFEPLMAEEGAPSIVWKMCGAGMKAGVGPMAAVAGAMAEAVGRELSRHTGEILVENGGDIFMISPSARVLGVYAGEGSPFTSKLAIEIPPSANGIGVCTSSGTVSHSLSFGKADAALVISDDTALADAVATATGNIIKGAGDIEKAIAFAKSIDGVRGVMVLFKDKIGSWGSIKIV